MGLAFADTDLFNPNTAAAEANRMDVETSHQKALFDLQERLSTAQTEADIQSIQREQRSLDAQHARHIQALNQKLAHQDIAFKTWMTVFTIISSAFALTLFITIIIWVGSKALVNIRSTSSKEELVKQSVPLIEKRIPDVAEREPYEPLNSQEILFAKRLNERLQEITAEREYRKESDLLAARMKSISDPAKMSSDEYWKRPQAS
jgi:hypothetical protein